MEEKILESIYSCYVTLGEIISEVRSVKAVEQATRKKAMASGDSPQKAHKKAKKAGATRKARLQATGERMGKAHSARVKAFGGPGSGTADERRDRGEAAAQAAKAKDRLERAKARERA